MTGDPYGQFRGHEAVSEEAFANLQTLVKQLSEAEAKVAELKAQLEVAVAARDELAHVRIPELMDSLGQERLVLTNLGVEVRVNEKIRASIPVDHRPKAFKWLEENGHGSLIKRSIVVVFNREQQEAAAQLYRQLQSEFAGVKQDMKVEPSTLAAFVREQLGNGSDLPLDLFGVFRQRVTEVKSK